MLRLSICVALLVFSGTILAQDLVQQEQQSLQINGKVGFFIFDRIRRLFCQRFCLDANANPYVANIICAVKCPELYLPHHSTTTSPTGTVTSTTTTVTTSPTATTVLSTTAQSTTAQSTTTPSTTTQAG